LGKEFRKQIKLGYQGIEVHIWAVGESRKAALANRTQVGFLGGLLADAGKPWVLMKLENLEPTWVH